jgi:hypothetical protein
VLLHGLGFHPFSLGREEVVLFAFDPARHDA